MRKIVWLLSSMILLLVMAVPVQADDALSDNPSTIQETTASETIDQTEATNEPTQPPHVHNWGSGEMTVAPTCTKPGVKTYTCSCSETKTEEIPLTGHTFGDWTEHSASKHKRICSSCGAEEEAKHRYGAWDIEENKHARSCKDCGIVKSEKHNWGSSIVLEKPTCKDEGILGYVCSVCDVVKEEAIAKLTVHTYDSACDPECNVCDYERDIEHDFEEIWVKDAVGHWYSCAKCDEQIAYAKHKPGPEATEEKEQVCTVCGYVIQPKKTHVHSFEKKWTTDEAGHWHTCKTCEAEQDYASHVYENDCDIDCNICGYEKETGHTYNDQWQTTKREHWNICTVCGEESKHEKHIAGPEATEEEAQLCTVCGYEIAPALVHSHDFENSWEWDTVNHWQTCKCGEISVAMEHSWDEGTEVKEDILEYRCTQCGATKMENVESGFPWIILLVILALICLGGIVALVIIIKRGEFDDETPELDDAPVYFEQTQETIAEEISPDEMSDLLSSIESDE